MGERLGRIWPSLVALLGTVGVVLVLLFVFGDNTGDTPDDDLGDIVVGGGDDTSTDGAEEGEGGPTDQPTDTPNDGGDEGDEDAGDDTSEEPSTEVTTAPPELRSPVGIANQTSVADLELRARERLEAGGWEVAATSGFNGNVPETTVYYPPGMEESARALSRQFPEISRVEPTFEGINQSRLVIILVDDYADVDG